MSESSATRPATAGEPISQQAGECAGHQQEGHKHHSCPRVGFLVNNKEVFVPPDTYPVATIKKLSGVPLADDLDQLIDRTLKPLPDDGTVKIRGCEVFVSHVKDGGSS